MNKFVSLLLCLIMHARLSTKGLGLGTPVITSTGSKKIEILTLDDSIACYDCMPHKFAAQNVTWLHKTRTDVYIHMVVDNDAIDMACDQRAYTPSVSQWARIEAILKDPVLLQALHTDYGIEEIVEIHEQKDLYTLTVNPHHNFFITDHHILVHNRVSRGPRHANPAASHRSTPAGKKNHHNPHNPHGGNNPPHTNPQQKNTPKDTHQNHNNQMYSS